jgi:hypothetical protein
MNSQALLPTNEFQPVTVKDAIDAAIKAGLTPKQFRKLAEGVADKLDGRKRKPARKPR